MKTVGELSPLYTLWLGHPATSAMNPDSTHPRGERKASVNSDTLACTCSTQRTRRSSLWSLISSVMQAPAGTRISTALSWTLRGLYPTTSGRTIASAATGTRRWSCLCSPSPAYCSLGQPPTFSTCDARPPPRQTSTTDPSCAHDIPGSRFTTVKVHLDIANRQQLPRSVDTASPLVCLQLERGVAEHFEIDCDHKQQVAMTERRVRADLRTEYGGLDSIATGR